jgi:hypothetical protein
MSDALHSLAGVVEYANATAISLARFEGAKEVGNQYYQNIQLQAAKGYAERRDALMSTFVDQVLALNSEFPALNSSTMQKANAYLSQNGLPPVEQQILSGLGLSNSIPSVTRGMLASTEAQTPIPSALTGVQEMQAALISQTNVLEKLSSPDGVSISVSNMFTNIDLSPLPTDSYGNPMVSVVVPHNAIRGTNPGTFLALTNITNTGTASLSSLKFNTTLPLHWQIAPAWLPSKGAIDVYYKSPSGALFEVTGVTEIFVVEGNPQTVDVSIPSLNATAAGMPLVPGAGILLSVKVTYDLKGSTSNSSNFPITYPDFTIASGWTGVSYANNSASQEGSSFFTVYANAAITTLRCDPSAVAAGDKTHCEAHITTSGSNALTGTTTFTSSDAQGTFSSVTCKSGDDDNDGKIATGNQDDESFSTTLSCRVDYTSSTPSAQKIMATYAGDTQHAGSSATFTLNGVNPAQETDSLTVQSVDQTGSPISGYYVTLYDANVNVLQSGFTMLTFTSLTPGQTYVVETDTGYGSCTFTEWEDSSTNYQRTFVATSSAEIFTASYSCS